MKNILKIIFSIIYIIGTCITFILSIIFLSHCEIILNPDAMLPFKLYEQAFALLSLGAIPMVISCYTIYKIFNIKESLRYKRNKILIFIPGLICVSCFIFEISLLTIGGLIYYIMQ